MVLSDVAHDVSTGKITNHDAAVRLKAMSTDDPRDEVRLAASNLQTVAESYLITERDASQASERDQLFASAIRHLNDQC